MLLLVNGVSQSDIDNLSISDKAIIKQMYLHGVWGGNYGVNQHEEIIQNLASVRTAFAGGKIKVKPFRERHVGQHRFWNPELV